MFMFNLIAAINNPVLQAGYGGDASDGSGALTKYIILLWRTLITLGGLAALLFFLWGALDWIIAGGEQGKVESARKKMTGAMIGFVILASTVAILTFLGELLGHDLLQITFPTVGSNTAVQLPNSGPAVPTQ